MLGLAGRVRGLNTIVFSRTYGTTEAAAERVDFFVALAVAGAKAHQVLVLYGPTKVVP